MNTPSPPNVPNFEKRVAQYVQLRDLIKQEDDAHKEKMLPKRETLEQLNSALLQALNAVNGDSISTAAGTVYRTERKSASVADMSAFWTFVVTQGDWDLVDKKANVTAVADYIAKHSAPPPGINFSTSYIAGVRRK
jgi:hypothetical protein